MPKQRLTEAITSPVPGSRPATSSRLSSPCLVRTRMPSVTSQRVQWNPIGASRGMLWRRVPGLAMMRGRCVGSPPLLEWFEKDVIRLLKVVVKDPEDFEQALREFRRKVQEQGLVREMRRRSHYVPPAEARKIKSLRARRRRTR